MYSNNPQTGEITRLSDGKVVAPCQSADDPDFVEYLQWAEAGNTATIINVAAPEEIVRVVTKLAYMNRFQDQELAALYTAAKSVVQIEIWLEKFKMSEFIDLDDPRTIGGVQALEAAGLLGVGRAAAILS